MHSFDVLEEAGELTRRGEPFALATVVWRQGPSSGQQGSRAIITAAGDLHGWIGGACAEPVVIREARQVITEGVPRLLLLGTPEQFAGRAQAGAAVPDGMTFVPIACQSEGALEVYIEPVLPAPHLVIVGRSPMVATLADLARTLGWRTTVLDRGAFSAADADESSMVVVATQGHGDEDAVEQAAAARPAYLGLVGSAKRGAAVLGLPQGPGRAAGSARPGAGARGPGPGPDVAPGDRGRDPGRAGPAARVGRSCPGGQRCGSAPRRGEARRRRVLAEPGNGGGVRRVAPPGKHRPGVRDDGRRRRVQAIRWSTRARPTTSAAPAAAGRSRRTRRRI